MREQIERLRAALPSIPESRRAFASSLVAYFDQHGRLSERQAYWVGQLLALPAQSAPEPMVTPDLPAAGITTVLGWFAHLRLTNPRGRARIVFPRSARVGGGLRLSAPSPTSQYNGTATMFVNQEGEYAGRITDGRFLPVAAVRANQRLLDRITGSLHQVLLDPLEATVQSGRATGTCCFCARELTDERSTSVGYGPICADHYGLPWGDRPATDALTVNEARARLGVPPIIDNLRRAAAARGEPLRPFEEGGPDDEDRQFFGGND